MGAGYQSMTAARAARVNRLSADIYSSYEREAKLWKEGKLKDLERLQRLRMKWEAQLQSAIRKTSRAKKSGRK